MLLGEVVDVRGQRRDIALKGSGRTPFSRGGDGRAALGPVLREYLMGEAMHALVIPTTRALAAVATGEPVRRDQVLPGAVLTRVAASHLRVGTFEFAVRRDLDLLRRLADHAIARHDPELAVITDDAERYLALLRAVLDRQAALIAAWMGIGFIHGVMNTDNISISGETIDYGPCAFLEVYDPATAFSSIDDHGRYAYGNQPSIGLWNLTRFAETLGPLIGSPDGSDREQVVPRLVEVLETFDARYAEHWTAVLRAKLGLDDAAPDGDRDDQGAAHDRALGAEYLNLLQRHRVDFTLGLAQAGAGRGRRRGSAAAGVRPGRRRGADRLAVPLARPLAAQRIRRGGPCGHAPREPDLHPAQPPGGAGVGGGRRDR